MFLFAIVGALFTGCSSDDDDNDGAPNDKDLVGFWIRYENNEQYLEELGFFADGTCNYTELFDPDDDDEEKAFYKFGKGTYVVKGNKLIMTLEFDDETEVLTYTIKYLKANGTLILTNEEGSSYTFENLKSEPNN